MATRTLNAEAVPVLEPIELERHDAPVFGRVRRHASWSRGAFALDSAMLLAAGLAATLGSRVAGIIPMPGVWVVLYSCFVLLALHTRRMYTWRVRLQVLDDIRSVLTATVLACMALVTLRILLPGEVDQLAGQSIRLWAFSAFYLVSGRIALDWAQLNARRAGEVAKPTLIVGAGRVGRLAARRLQEHPEFGLRPVGFLDKEPLDISGLPVPVLGASWDLERLVEQHGIEHLVITFSTAPSEVLLREIKHCEELGVGVSLVPRLFESVTERLSVEHIGGLPLLSVRRTDPRGWEFALKHVADRAIALLLLMLTAPIFAVAALGTLLSVGRPIFFRQPRIGRDERRFEMLKFRSMVEDAHQQRSTLADQNEHDGPLFKIKDDPRVTPVGRYLRRYSIDELPQLWNVVKGDMSLVGPRPPLPSEYEAYHDAVHRRLRVRPGLTGLWQVSGRADLTWEESVRLDLRYVDNWSIALDLQILWKTAKAVLRGSGAY